MYLLWSHVDKRNMLYLNCWFTLRRSAQPTSFWCWIKCTYAKKREKWTKYIVLLELEITFINCFLYVCNCGDQTNVCQNNCQTKTAFKPKCSFSESKKYSLHFKVQSRESCEDKNVLHTITVNQCWLVRAKNMRN